MEEKNNQLLNLIDQAKKILITTHISPDPDALSSALLLGCTLSLNYPLKQVVVNLEESPIDDLSFLAGYDTLKFQPLLATLQSFKPDLFIIVDANSYQRCSRHNSQSLKDYVQSHSQELKTIIIDHHEPTGKDEVDLYINNRNPATVQEVYQLLFKGLSLKTPSGYAEMTMLGIISDTNRFKYLNQKHRETFKLVSDLIDAGVSIEKLENRLKHYTRDEIVILGNLATNIVSGAGYSYTYISDDIAQSWRRQAKAPESLKIACELFANLFIRNIDGNPWGFIVYPDLLAPAGQYSVSFRAIGGSVDVSAIAARLGGGGHKPAAAAKVQAENVQQAVDTIKSITSEK